MPGGAPLTRELAGCHKVYVDPETRWRMVVQFCDAPATFQHRREIYLLAVGERQDHAAYNLASHRLERERTTSVPAHQRRAQAAQSRSPHSGAQSHTSAQLAPAASPTPRSRRAR
ncbi:hypothetical protein ACFVTY_09210 [Streptomyces sp. NPDC058067]|uniref:hypothetical protein n=1 Tax=Streptomyces sp. NPDC058067 TaxID=3346324 RepID=UPI0036EFD470